MHRVSFVLVSAFALSCSNGPAEPRGDTTPAGVGADTQAAAQINAGEAPGATCIVLDAQGNPYSAGADVTSAVAYAPPLNAAGLATQAGTLTAACTVTQNGNQFVDPTPASITVNPGPPARTSASVSSNAIHVGESVTVTCEVFDAYDNAVTSATPTIAVSPSDGTEIAGQEITITREGSYVVACDVPGVANRQDQTVTVGLGGPAGAAARITASIEPVSTTYAVNQEITVQTIVEDAMGNPLLEGTYAVLFESTPAMNRLGDNRFRIATAGNHHVTATVAGTTVQGSVDFLVGDATPFPPPPPGPGTDPGDTVIDHDGDTLPIEPSNIGPDGTVQGNYTFHGCVPHPAGVAHVRVNGTEVTLSADGCYDVAIHPSFGMNFVEISIETTSGDQYQQLISYVASAEWLDPEDGILASSITSKLRQPFFDDGIDGELDSLNDFLLAILNGDGLSTVISNQMAGRGSVLNSCVGLGCAFRMDVTQHSMDFGRTNDVALELIDGGLRLAILMPHPILKYNIGLNSQIWVGMDDVSMVMEFDIIESAGRPVVAPRGTPEVNVRYVSLDPHFDLGAFALLGAPAVVVELIALVILKLEQFFLQGYLQRVVERAIATNVQGAFGVIMDGLIGGLAPNLQGGWVEVPSLLGAATTRVFQSAEYESLSVNADRLFSTYSTSFLGEAAHARGPGKVAIPPGARPHEPETATTSALAVHTGVINQQLHALWRGGLLDGSKELVNVTLPGQPAANVQVDVLPGLPPVAALRVDGRVNVGFGSLGLSFQGATARTEVTVGAMLSSDLGMDGTGRLVFNNVTVDRLLLAGVSPALLSATDRQTVETALRPFLSETLVATLSTGLPALPLPTYVVPTQIGDLDLAMLGLPVGSTLGYAGATMFREDGHIVLRADFGLSGPPVGSPVVCGDRTTCDSCVAATNCGWCASTNTCSDGDDFGPSAGTCDPGAWMAQLNMCGGTI